jgi:hypothetical protein
MPASLELGYVLVWGVVGDLGSSGPYIFDLGEGKISGVRIMEVGGDEGLSPGSATV